MHNSSQSFEQFIYSHRERREADRDFKQHHSTMTPHHLNSEDDMRQYRVDNTMLVRDAKLISGLSQDSRAKSNSGSHSPFASFNDQPMSQNPIDDYGRTWTSATLATPCDDGFPMVSDEKPKRGHEDHKIKESQSDIIKNIKLTYLSASSLSDDRWICPICLDIFDDAVETPCCHNLFCEKCILLANVSNEIQNKVDCPLCNKTYDLSEIVPNVPIRRLVNELSIKCINDKCAKVIKKGDLMKHLSK